MALVFYNKGYTNYIRNWLQHMVNMENGFPESALADFIDHIAKEKKIMNRVRGTCIVDRCHKYRYTFQTTSDTMPPFEYSNSASLEELMFRRAEQIINRKKPIQFFWSGGIDSTAALAVLLKFGTPRIHIELTPSSIEECPGYWPVVAKHHHKIHTDDSLFAVADPTNHVVVECGSADALYGSMGEDHLKGDLKRVWYIRNRFGRVSRRYRFFQNFKGHRINLENIMPFYDEEMIEKYFINRIIDGSLVPFNRDDDSEHLKNKMELRNIIASHTNLEGWAFSKAGNWSIRNNEKKIREIRANILPRYYLMAIKDDGTCINRNNSGIMNKLPNLTIMQDNKDLKDWCARQ
tara:strand:- start:2023 stop:3069 length:1047 start_codon:yes stop_codon:yes gene_type:complete